MKIAVDGGGLCADKNHRFGNYIVTENLIKAVQAYDKKNSYFFYSFCQPPFPIKESKRFTYLNLQPKIFWSKLRTSLEEVSKKKDYFFALNQSIPFFTRSKIISFSHGLSFHFYPDFYSDSAKKMEKQHEEMIKRSSIIIVPSIKVKNELNSIFPNTRCGIVVIPYGVPLDMIESKSKVKTQKLKTQVKNQNSISSDKFFLTVGMNHPIKNRKILPTNKYKFIFAERVNRKELKQLYSRATALVTTSLYESFNLPVLEALSQNCPVIGLKLAIIPELVEYVNIAENQESLINLMKKAKKNQLKKINQKKLLNQFSWRRYVESLNSLY